MRPLSFLAVLSAVLSAGAAHACCLFKSAGPAAPMPPPAAVMVGPAPVAAGPAAAGPRAAAAAAGPGVALPAAGYSPYLEIFTVGGFAPDSTWDVSADLSPDYV